MPRYAAPATVYASRFSAGVSNTGLAGTVRFRLIDSDLTADDPVYGPSTTGVVEDPTGSGDYMVRITLPSTEGTYFPAWDLGSGQLFYDEDVVVTRTAIEPSSPSGHEYVTRDELKVSLEIPDEDDMYDDEIDEAVEAASRAIDLEKRTRYYPSTEVRKYTPLPGETTLWIDQLNTLTSITVDLDGDGTYETTWTNGTDFVLEPANAAADGIPWDRIVLLPQGAAVFPAYIQSVKVSGSFGWSTTPTVVKKAARILAERYFKRRETPFAFLVSGGDSPAVATLRNTDPDVAALLANVPPVRNTVTSPRLG